MKILVVDDEKLLVKGIKFNLENDGYEVLDGYIVDWSQALGTDQEVKDPQTDPTGEPDDTTGEAPDTTEPSNGDKTGGAHTAAVAIAGALAAVIFTILHAPFWLQIAVFVLVSLLLLALVLAVCFYFEAPFISRYGELHIVVLAAVLMLVSYLFVSPGDWVLI